MFSNVALDVSIGLVFIFLIYSLLASIIQEMVARMLSLRGRMLIKGIRVMLEDNHEEKSSIPFIGYIVSFFNSFFKTVRNFYRPLPKDSLAKKFYDQPTIKYLSESTHNNKPSYIGPANFSESMTKLLRGIDFDGTKSQMDAIKTTLDEWQTALNEAKLVKDKEHVKSKLEHIIVTISQEEIKIGVETLHQIQQLFIDAQNDIDKFKALLENWFDHTMDRVNGWYKRQTQTVLLIIGFGIAFSFNVDSISVYHVLAKDKKAREAMVQMAISEKSKMGIIVDSLKKRSKTVEIKATINGRDTTITKDSVFVNATNDYLDTTYKALVNDAEDADKILGLGKPYSDQIDSLEEARSTLQTDSAKLPDLKTKNRAIDSGIAVLKAKTHHLQYGPRQKGGIYTFFGWLITALAISLGAPFWFDMLNKLISLRSSGKKSDNASDGNNNNASDKKEVSPLKRVG